MTRIRTTVDGVLYAASWRAGEPSPGDDADAAQFFGRAEMPEIAFASTAHAIERWPAKWQTGAP